MSLMIYEQHNVFLFLVLPSRTVDTTGTVGCGAAPDALVAAGAMAVLARGAMEAPRTVAWRATPFAVLLVIAVFMLPRW